MSEEGETIQCTTCRKCFFEDGFKVNRLGRRLKTCLECNTRDKASRERDKQEPEKVGKKQAVWWRLKNNPEQLAARRTQQVLSGYKKDFPDDPDQPTSSEEAAIKRVLQHRARAKRVAEEKGQEALAIHNRNIVKAAPPEVLVASNSWGRGRMHHIHTQGVNEDARRMGFVMVNPENYSAKNRLTEWVCLTCEKHWEMKWAALKSDPSSRLCLCITDDELNAILTPIYAEMEPQKPRTTTSVDCNCSFSGCRHSGFSQGSLY